MEFSDKNVRQAVYLNLFLIAIYFLVFFNLKTGIDYFIMFSSPDSQDYLSVGNWIFENAFTDKTLNNPVLYPFVLKLVLLLFGVTGVWFFQFLLWLLSVNLLFYSVQRITNKRFACTGALILSFNLSYIALTLHALTDVTVTFLVCWLIFFLTRRINNFKTINFFYTIILFFSVLSVIKPVFFPPLIALLFIIFPVFYFKTFLKSRRKFLLVLALLPVLFQMTLMFVKHDKISLSEKGNTTFKIYFFAQCYADVNKINIENAVSVAENKSADSIVAFMLVNKAVVVKKFFGNVLFENLTGPATFLVYPPEYKNMKFFYLMKLENWFFLTLHLIFIIPCLYLLFYLWKTKSRMFSVYCFLLFLFYYLVLITGMAYWQGDRYAVSFQPLWIIIYLLVLSRIRYCSLPFFKIKTK